jgi:type VI secretion system secreted protein Hcp
MAYDAFMWFTGGDPTPKGESSDATYKAKGAFEIYSFSLGASNPVQIGSASPGAGAGKVSLSSFNIMKKMDKSSPVLFLACCKGGHYTKADVVLRKAGGTAMEYLTYTFTEVFVESIQWSGSSGGDDVPTESVSFAFGKLEMKYIPQDEKGGPGTAVPATWDLRENKSK